MKTELLPLRSYLHLTSGALARLRGDSTLCVASDLPQSRLRLVVMVAPREHCWGMEFAFSRFYKECDRVVEETILAEQVASEILGAGLRLEDIPQGMIPLAVDPMRGEFEYGGNGGVLDPCWFRCFVLPPKEGLFELFLDTWTSYEVQLPEYFMPHYPDTLVHSRGVGMCFAPWKDADILDRLFCARFGPMGVPATDLLRLLNHYHDDINVQTLNEMLTPEFLLQEPVRWSTTLLGGSTNRVRDLASAIKGVLAEKLGGNLDVASQIALLRIRIAHKLGWPLGVRNLASILGSSAEGERSASVLVRETQAYIDSAHARFPVLKL